MRDARDPSSNRRKQPPKPRTPTDSPDSSRRPPPRSNGPDPESLRFALEGTIASPSPSPTRKKARVTYGDRFIPNREGVDLQASYGLLHADGSPSTPSKPKKRTPHGEINFQKTEEANSTYQHLLRSELFHNEIPQSDPPAFASSSNAVVRDLQRSPPPTSNQKPPTTPSKKLFAYMSPTSARSRRGAHFDPRSEVYSLSPVRYDNQKMLLSPRKQPRAVSRVPYKVLDAPELADDFYLNLVDWGSTNILGVGLGSCVYMWNSTSGKVTKLCDLGADDSVTSVAWIQRGSHISIGTSRGHVQIWDINQSRRLRTMLGHSARVGALAWNDHILSSGSRDRLIYHRDVRAPDQYIKRLSGHKQEVCGLKWNCDDGQLASGGNDNKLLVWDKLSEQPLYKFTEHTAAVKAISWSPHQHGLLASGGGTADRRIKFWNTLTGQPVNEIDTGSQVCNLAWSKNSNEIVSTHGFSENQIVVWKYPSMSQVATLTGHTFRVLYLAMSPDGQTIVTGAGDETLRFWNCFAKSRSAEEISRALDPFQAIR